MFYLHYYDVYAIGGDIINIYDFDGTIYNGDSSIDFYKYCIKENKKCLLIIPNVIKNMMLYKLKIITKEKYKSTFFSFIKYFNNIEEQVEKFWSINNKKIKSFYLQNKKSTDIIISASPEFLLKPLTNKLEVNLIATKVDKKTGKLQGKNCHGEEKVKMLAKNKIYKCEKFYSDSKSDKPCTKIAKKSYMVNKNKIIPWEK